MAEDDKKEEQKGVKELDKELNAFVQSLAPSQQQKQPKKIVKRVVKGRRKEVASIITKGKRKEAVARASLKSGKGEITINGIDIKMIRPLEVRELIMEPIRLSGVAKQIAASSNISINAYGGGVSGQAQAARNAIAKAMVAASRSEELKKFYMDYDRFMLIDDHRRVEPKKFNGPKARARFQTSYR